MMKLPGTKLLTKVALPVALFMSSMAQADSKYNLPTPVDPTTRAIYDLHMMTSLIALVLMIAVTAIVVYSLFKFRKSKGYEPDQNFHKSWFGRWAWVLVPVLVLGLDMAIAGRAAGTLKSLYNHPDADITVKITGSQWKWSYEYLEDGIKFSSNLNRDLTPDDKKYLRDVDNPLVLPVDTEVRFLHTATDVLHNWWVPAIAFKVDAVPGFINETRTRIEQVGEYWGQCAENCGTGHAFMPIIVRAVSKEDYAVWKQEQQAATAAATEEASADKVWDLDTLVARGEEIYQKSCVACHQAEGQGVPGVFPALKAGPITTGELDKHIQTVVNGVEGTAMAAWKNQLNDLEIAAVVTYERNAWGNDMGDMAQPADIKAAR